MSTVPFILASLAILLTPGPTNTILAASGAAMGMRTAIALPVAEAIGYAVAISLFLAAAGFLHDVPAAMPALKAFAAVWLLVCAARLWSQLVVPELPDRRGAFQRVLLTTMLNPKAMLVGTIIIPSLMPGDPVRAVACFAALSILAGAGWTMLGALLPSGVRRHSYKGAAMIIAGFAFAAAVGALQS